MLVRRLTGADAMLLRDVRLAALGDSPSAYEATYEREAQLSDADWFRRADSDTSLIAELEGRAVGLVALVADAHEPGVSHLYAMWVHPDVRRTGVGGQLVQAAIEAARADPQCRLLRLHVVADNDAARRLYERLGFAESGRLLTREWDGAPELEMELSLRPPA